MAVEGGRAAESLADAIAQGADKVLAICTLVLLLPMLAQGIATTLEATELSLPMLTKNAATTLAALVLLPAMLAESSATALVANII